MNEMILSEMKNFCFWDNGGHRGAWREKGTAPAL